MTIEEALHDFYEKNQLGPDGGLNDSWAKIKVWKFYLPFPNTPARKKALRFHDVHHILTGYKNDWKGEAEIGAWEVSTGCGNYRAAWIFDMGIFALGFFIFPIAVFRAFIRGRQTHNFYCNSYSYQQVLQMPVAEARAVLKLNAENSAHVKFKEAGAFIFWWLVAFVVSFAVFVAPVAWIIHLIVDK